jgi:hypothetical protein
MMLWYDIMVCHEEEEVSSKRVAGLSVGSNVTNIWQLLTKPDWARMPLPLNNHMRPINEFLD